MSESRSGLTGKGQFQEMFTPDRPGTVIPHDHPMADLLVEVAATVRAFDRIIAEDEAHADRVERESGFLRRLWRRVRR